MTSKVPYSFRMNTELCTRVNKLFKIEFVYINTQKPDNVNSSSILPLLRVHHNSTLFVTLLERRVFEEELNNINEISGYIRGEELEFTI